MAGDVRDRDREMERSDRDRHGPLGSVPTATEQETSAGPQIQVYWKGTHGPLWEADTSGGSKWSGPTSHGMGPHRLHPTPSRR